jgi:transaldolase
MDAIKKRTLEIATLIKPYPLSVEVTSNDPEEMIRQGREFAEWSDNINVKITIHGPQGETENLEVIHELETVHDVRVNVTAMMSAQQCLLAALAGATYVSLFGGRVNNMGYDSRVEIEKIREVFECLGIKSQIIIGSTREILNIFEWLLAGAHIVTVTPNLLKGMIVHPYSKETVQMFLDDAAKGMC